jgi:hypothetical protein
MPVFDPEKLLKPKGYFRSTASYLGNKYQPKLTQVNTKVLVEILTPKEFFEQTPSVEASTRETAIKIEIDPSDTQNSLNKRPSSIPAIATFLSTPSSLETKVYVLRNPEECTLYPDSSHVGSPIYTSCKYEEANPHFPFPPLLDSTPYNDRFPVFSSLQPEELEQSPFWSLAVYKNLSLTPEVHPLDIKWLLLEEVAPEVPMELEAVKDHHLHLLGFLPKWEPNTLL